MLLSVVESITRYEFAEEELHRSHHSILAFTPDRLIGGVINQSLRADCATAA
jgi:hypothetical protein